MINPEGYLEHIQKLLRDSEIPNLPDEYAENPLIGQIHEDLKAIREITLAFSSGDFSPTIKARGIIPGCLKSLQANLRHLIWQVQMVEKGDFNQEVHFMGEFSNAFNSMVRIFSLSLSKLQEKGETLAVINDKLRKEVEHVVVLKKNEAHYKFLASHDPLTGIFNRRAFIETAEVELANALYNCVPCCLAMMDIDHFKRFNDTYGHQAGDAALRHAVKTIESKLRKNDFMGRYGGEEFTFFFYDADEEKGQSALERIRKFLADSPVPLEKGPVEIHASFGFTVVDLERSAEKGYVETLIKEADTALYAAKLAGRNRVVLFSQETESHLDSYARLFKEGTENREEEAQSEPAQAEVSVSC
ncbi:MAG: GGDEF domain-containing protein [Treponema sp.]|jgi:diguanylate cyclase (GGDEF)-like protein|nr:GGDEF domain-containing protein [Treponema sp.]